MSNFEVINCYIDIEKAQKSSFRKYSLKLFFSNFNRLIDIKLKIKKHLWIFLSSGIDWYRNRW